MVERKWKIVETEKGAAIVPTFELKCPFCGTTLILHDFAAYHNKIHNFYHVDIHMKCPNCSWWTTFGVPITKEEYEKLSKSPLNRKILRWELTKILNNEDKEKIEERLRSWGYW